LIRCHARRAELFSLPMVDIHCHILTGLDDGAPSLEVSLQMAEMAIAEGITHIVATPHANSQFPFVSGTIRERREELQLRLADRLTLATGCDFHLSYENLRDIREHRTKYTLNQKNYLLVEFADFAIPPAIEQELHQLQLAGIRPIITHPERNPLIRSQPERLLQWMRQGCYVQVTALSFLGRFGGAAKQFVEMLLAREGIHFVASDAHNTTSRPLKLREAFDRVTALKGAAAADSLFRDNPKAAFDGQPLPYTPDVPSKLEPPSRASHDSSGKRRKRFGIF
jgi:protein-tyrosine phosphatase